MEINAEPFARIEAIPASSARQCFAATPLAIEREYLAEEGRKFAPFLVLAAAPESGAPVPQAA